MKECYEIDENEDRIKKKKKKRKLINSGFDEKLGEGEVIKNERALSESDLDRTISKNDVRVQNQLINRSKLKKGKKKRKLSETVSLDAEDYNNKEEHDNVNKKFKSENDSDDEGKSTDVFDDKKSVSNEVIEDSETTEGNDRQPSEFSVIGGHSFKHKKVVSLFC